MMARRLIAALALLATGACSTLGNLWTGGPRELPRVRDDAAAMSCEAGKTLLVRMEPGGKSAWIILPEREFRLDLVQGAADTRYSNGRTTLVVQGDQVSVEEGGVPSFANCRKRQA
jgi:membrane-bound inhibitor of C-type lysozyme